MEKCVDLFEQKASISDAPDAVPMTISSHSDAGSGASIQFDNVSFSYPSTDGKRRVGLRDVTFSVPPGRTVAIVGATGAGKTYVYSPPLFL